MAIGSGSIKSLKKLYQRKVGDAFDPESIAAEMEIESDRSCVILVGSMLEDELLNLICDTLHLRDNLSGDEKNAMFGPDGPLGSFSKKIALAYAFSLIEKEERDQLTIIREMRNACAHCMGPISFRTPELAAVAKQLTHKDNKPITSQYFGDDAEQLRYAFMSESLCLATVLRLGDREKTRASFHQSTPSPDTPTQPASGLGLPDSTET